jgi:hypothetical protein
MKLPHRRQFLHLAAGAAVLPAMSRSVWAQAYPARPVRIVVGFAAGGGSDILSRLIAQWLSDRFGQTFIVENRTGAGSNLAAEAVVHAPPDGHTLLLATSGNAINATLYDKLNYNLIRDNGQGFSSGQREIPLIASLRVLRALHSLEDESCRDVVEPFRQTTVSILCRYFIRRADYDEQNAKLQDMPHGRLPWLQGKSFAPLIT